MTVNIFNFFQLRKNLVHFLFYFYLNIYHHIYHNILHHYLIFIDFNISILVENLGPRSATGFYPFVTGYFILGPIGATVQVPVPIGPKGVPAKVGVKLIICDNIVYIIGNIVVKL